MGKDDQTLSLSVAELDRIIIDVLSDAFGWEERAARAAEIIQRALWLTRRGVPDEDSVAECGH